MGYSKSSRTRQREIDKPARLPRRLAFHYARMIFPGRHGRHVLEGVRLRLLPRELPVLTQRPADHAFETRVEILQLSFLVDAVLAVGTAFDRHAAAFAIVGHGLLRVCSAAMSARMSSSSLDSRTGSSFRAAADNAAVSSTSMASRSASRPLSVIQISARRASTSSFWRARSPCDSSSA